MSGLWRNLLTMLVALFKRDRPGWQADHCCGFWVSPFDVGIRTLKSDRYLQIAEAAQLDFGVRTGLLAAMRTARCAMVNAEQRIRFAQPIRLFDRIRVTTRIASADSKWVHFEHVFQVRGQMCAVVEVKAKFKQGRLTVALEQLMPPG